MKKLIFLIPILASSIYAAPPPIAYEIEADYQQTQSLPSQSFQQGSSVQLRYKLTSDGGYLDLSGLTGKWQGRSSATSTNYITQTTATTVTSTTPDYIQFDLDYTATGTAVTNWVYSMIITYGGNDYVMGEGELDIQASAWTGSGHNLTSDSNVTKLIAGTGGVTLSPTSGVGDVTISVTSASVGFSDITGSATDNADLNTELTNRYTKAETDAGFLALSGGTLTGDVGMGSNSLTDVESIQANINVPVPAHSEGYFGYDPVNKCYFFYNDRTAVKMDLGREIWKRAKNVSGQIITNGMAVYIADSVGDQIAVDLAVSTNLDMCRTIAIATEDVAINDWGEFTTVGLLHDVDTISLGDDGADLWLSDIKGQLTTNKPSALANYVVYVGEIAKAHASIGIIDVNLRPAVVADEIFGFADSETDPVYTSNTYATGMNQGVASTDSPTFGGGTFTGDVANVATTNTLTMQFYTASNRWAYIDVYGSTTNITFISPTR